MEAKAGEATVEATAWRWRRQRWGLERMVFEVAAEVKAVEARVPVAMEAVGKEKATEMVVKALAVRAAEAMVGGAAAATTAMAVKVEMAALVAAEVW